MNPSRCRMGAPLPTRYLRHRQPASESQFGHFTFSTLCSQVEALPPSLLPGRRPAPRALSDWSGQPPGRRRSHQARLRRGGVELTFRVLSGRDLLRWSRPPSSSWARRCRRGARPAARRAPRLAACIEDYGLIGSVRLALVLWWRLGHWGDERRRI